MKAHVYREGGIPWNLEEVPDPTPGPLDVIVQMEAAGICGTDVGYRFGETKPRAAPLIPGHEIAGIVVEKGRDVQGVRVGDRVCVHYIVSCSVCRHCSGGNDNRCRSRRSIGAHISGGFAEYIALPSRNVFCIPESISMEVGAIIGCAVTTAYHALQCAHLERGETVVVFGLGGVGMHVVQWARMFGAGLIAAVDVVETKLEVASRFGADVLIDPGKEKPAEKILSLTEGYGADVAVECSGHPAGMKQALDSIHGKSVYESGRLVGVAAYLDQLVIDQPQLFREGAFIRSGDHNRSELRTVIELAANGRVDFSESITHRFPFEDLEQPLGMLRRREGNIVRSVLRRVR